MNDQKLKGYRFANDAQWNACLFVGADRSLRHGSGGILPLAPYTRPATLLESDGASAPEITRAGNVLWRDDNCGVHSLSKCDDEPDVCLAPVAIARAARIVATPSGLWVIGEVPDSLQRFEEATLTRLLTVNVPNAAVKDIANGGHDSIVALVERQGVWQAERIDRLGHIVETIEFKGIAHAEKFVLLRNSRHFVVLAGDLHPRLYWFSAKGGPAFFSLAVAGMRPCFEGHVLGSDSSDRVFLAGTDGDTFGQRSYVVSFDADGNSLGELAINAQDAPVTGITASRDNLFVTGKRGLLQFKGGEFVPEGVGQVQCKLLTPMFFSPDREDRRRWLRIEATANLPQGTTLEIAWGATDDAALSERLNAIQMDGSIPASQRVAKLLDEPDLRRDKTVFHGAVGSVTPGPQTYSAKLFHVDERYLWVCATLTAATGARLPLLSELAILYPGRTLMEELPGIYQKEEAQPDSFLRALVGVLETTTQGLDARIRSLGRQVHPATAPELWLDFVARWLGVPWDDALTLQQKRSIIMRAPDLAQGRGTRAGLEALLDGLLPGTPRRFRVVDVTADFGFAVVGGESCPGSTLPAMLGGRSRWNAELDSSAVLGYTRLPCAMQLEDRASQLAGKVRIDVAATAAEKTAWEPWLLALITEMVPLMARVELRWVTLQSLRTNRLDGTMLLESAPTAHLGTDAITSLARLPEHAPRLSETGPIAGTRLN